jgi:hypothetical protein
MQWCEVVWQQDLAICGSMKLTPLEGVTAYNFAVVDRS